MKNEPISRTTAVIYVLFYWIAYCDGIKMKLGRANELSNFIVDSGKLQSAKSKYNCHQCFELSGSSLGSEFGKLIYWKQKQNREKTENKTLNMTTGD